MVDEWAFQAFEQDAQADATCAGLVACENGFAVLGRERGMAVECRCKRCR